MCGIFAILNNHYSEEIINAKSGKIIVKLGEKINFVTAKKLANEGLKEIYVANPSLYGNFFQKVILSIMTIDIYR